MLSLKDRKPVVVVHKFDKLLGIWVGVDLLSGSHMILPDQIIKAT